MMLRPSYLDLINVVNNEAEPGRTADSEPLLHRNCDCKACKTADHGDEALVIEWKKPLSIRSTSCTILRLNCSRERFPEEEV